VKPAGIWPCRVHAITHHPSGRRVVCSRRFEGAGDVVAAALASICARRGGPHKFLGCEIIITTPLGQRLCRVLEWDPAVHYALIPSAPTPTIPKETP